MVQLESCSTRPPTLLIFNSHVKLKVRARKPHCPSNMPPAQSRHGDHLPKLLTTIAHGPHRARLDGSNPRCSVGLRNAHQKSASSENSRPPPLVPPPITPAFWYSPTRRSKKLVLPCIEIRSIQLKGLVLSKCASKPSSRSSRSATNSMYCVISFAFIPMSETGSASVTKLRSMSTASVTISRTLSRDGGRSSFEKSRQAKSQCRPSSREMSSFENVRPGIRPRFFSQKSAQKEPEKKMPSTAAKATSRSAKDALSPIQRNAHCALRATHGTSLMAPSNRRRSEGSWINVSISNEYVSEWMFSIASWKP
mmetsp:Transcript_19152/g.57762  ORF Transcript_19152/g.57762 Transcript_19152/m.57762 type:complete len:309 (+) Transcript_19152:200-1126(+)